MSLLSRPIHGEKIKHGALYPEEIALAKEVYEDTLPYDRIIIFNAQSHTQGITVATSPFRKRAKYRLFWGDAFKTNIALADDEMKSTFIHELAHVWQSQHSGSHAMSYMMSSVWQQFRKGTQDIFKRGYKKGFRRLRGMYKKGFQKEWDYHRNMAYQFDPKDIGGNFNEFNVEQQAMLIETWYMGHSLKLRDIEYEPGNSSKLDSRFPYVRDCIRMGEPDVFYSR